MVALNRAIVKGRKNRLKTNGENMVEAAEKDDISVVMHTDGILCPGARTHTHTHAQ